MLIECSHCRALVDAQEVGAGEQIYEDESGRKGGHLHRLLRCPQCHTPILTEQRLSSFDDEQGHSWSVPKRLWPATGLPEMGAMPDAVKHALQEANRAMYGEAYSASVVMSVQAIEGICRHFETKSDNLFRGLKELLDQNIIDKMLHDWGQELRAHRNLAAHATGTKFTRTDAEDIFDFTKTICEYVFVLTRRFERFKTRAKLRQPSKKNG